MKYLIMCEGPNELKIIDILLDHDCLLITRDDLLGLEAYHARQIAGSSVVQIALNMYPGEVTVLRIGDKMNEKLKIPKLYEKKIISVEDKWLMDNNLDEGNEWPENLLNKLRR